MVITKESELDALIGRTLVNARTGERHAITDRADAALAAELLFFPRFSLEEPRS